MSDDPIRDLENFSPGGPSMSPLPAREVRRRGDRMRRRRTAALSVAGAAAVAAVIATPLALADGNGDAGRDPGFTTSSPSVTTLAPAKYRSRSSSKVSFSDGPPPMRHTRSG